MAGSFKSDRFIREAECREVTGLSRTTRWRLEREGKFPKRRLISKHAVAWLESEVQEWLQARAALSDSEGDSNSVGVVAQRVVSRLGEE